MVADTAVDARNAEIVNSGENNGAIDASSALGNQGAADGESAIPTGGLDFSGPAPMGQAGFSSSYRCSPLHALSRRGR